MSFDHQGRIYMFDIQTEWYEELSDLLEDLEFLDTTKERKTGIAVKTPSADTSPKLSDPPTGSLPNHDTGVVGELAVLTNGCTR